MTWSWPAPPSARSGRSASRASRRRTGWSSPTSQSYDFGLIGQAVRQGEAAIGLVLSSDGSLAADS